MPEATTQPTVSVGFSPTDAETGKITYTKEQQTKISALQAQYETAQQAYAGAIEKHNAENPAHPEITTALNSMQALRQQLLELKATNGLKQTFTPSAPRGGTVFGG